MLLLRLGLQGPERGFCSHWGPAVTETEILRPAFPGGLVLREDGEGGAVPETFHIKDSPMAAEPPGSLFLGLASCLGHFHFYLLRVVSRSWQAGDAMLMTPAPRGDHSGKSCNVLSATLIRETHQELLRGDSFPSSTCPAY